LKHANQLAQLRFVILGIIKIWPLHHSVPDAGGSHERPTNKRTPPTRTSRAALALTWAAALAVAPRLRRVSCALW
jgi:hypothetical protein